MGLAFTFEQLHPPRKPGRLYNQAPGSNAPVCSVITAVELPPSEPLTVLLCQTYPVTPARKLRSADDATNGRLDKHVVQEVAFESDEYTTFPVWSSSVLTDLTLAIGGPV
ncbi:hypothetical protein SKAU_G00113180 [Synaphobranchus kaupii]|uniref:Uncharacterized protein n=1 Tax=Synaphobranchus kaupii TaxID=118154 RepID=A0A9Q1G1M9_SYNKA|nr:hypothetical protein SKAU_G00113180 [Synaphobranchus kaupii]